MLLLFVVVVVDLFQMVGTVPYTSDVYASQTHAMYSGKVTVEEIVHNCPNYKPELMTPTLQETVKLEIYLTPYHFISISNADEEMTFSGLIDVHWDNGGCENSQGLANHSTMAKLYPRPNAFWKPTIHMLQSREMFLMGGERREALQIEFRPGGGANNAVYLGWKWSIMGEYTFHCDLDLFLFPGDIQNCSLRFQTQEPMQIYGFQQCIIFYDPLKMPFTLENSNWRLLNMSCTIMEGYELDSLVVFSFQMRRMSQFYILHLLGPCFLLVILEFCSFSLPARGAERSTYTMTIYLAFIFLETNLLNILPKTPKRILLSEYILFQSTFSTAITVYSAILSRVTHRLEHLYIRFHGSKISWLIALDFIGFILCLLAFIIETVWIMLQIEDTNRVDGKTDWHMSLPADRFELN